MRAPKTDIYFAADDAHTFLPWLISIMVFLAALLLCLAISINGWVSDGNSNYTDRFTVNIPAKTKEIEKKIPDITKLLLGDENIKNVREIPKDEMQEMLEPWLGRSSIMDELPFPTILEVELSSSSKPINYDKLQNKLQKIIPELEIDAYEKWVAAFASFSTATHSLTIILALLIIAGMGIMISFTSRAALKLHSKTVKLLHSIGAEDSYITRQFQKEAFRLVLPGAFAGCLAAGIGYFLAGLYISSLQTAIMPSLEITRAHIILLLLIPFICTLVAWFVARYSVINELERSL